MSESGGSTPERYARLANAVWIPTFGVCECLLLGKVSRFTARKEE